MAETFAATLITSYEIMERLERLARVALQTTSMRLLLDGGCIEMTANEAYERGMERRHEGTKGGGTEEARDTTQERKEEEDVDDEDEDTMTRKR